jgi:type II secretory pathway component GspD/PulD (secretin)
MHRAALPFLALVAGWLGCGSGGGSVCTLLTGSTGGQLSQAAVPVPQVVIEARIVEATRDFSRTLGVDWDLTTPVQEDGGGTLGGFNGHSMDLLARSGATGGEADRLYLIPGNHDPNSYFGVVWQDFVRGFGETAVFAAAPPFVCFLIDGGSQVPLSGFPGIELSSPPVRDPGLSGATIHTELLDDAQLSAILQAIQANSLNRVISAPGLTTYSGQRVAITVQDFTPAAGRLTPDFSNLLTPIVASPLGIFAGLTLEVTPTVAPNERVSLGVRLGSLGISAYLSQPFDADGRPSDLEFPIVQTSRAFTDIEVADGQTAFIGGITLQGQSQMEAGLPFLKELPLIGLLFGDGNIFQEPDAELLVFLTPHILRPD